MLYLYPYFRPAWRNYPNLEEFLSLFDTYLEFSPQLRKHPSFANDEVDMLRKELLRAISIHLCKQVAALNIRHTCMFQFAKRLRRNDIVITFNWDYLLERALFTLNHFGRTSYRAKANKIGLLGPHGSVDWFDRKEIKLARERSSKLMTGPGTIHFYRYFRFPRVDRRIVPVIIPPAIRKDFSSPEFRQIWRDGYTALRTTDEVYILGFSLPPEDLHVRFVIRSALRANEAARATPLKVSIVNPDRAVFLRFGRLVQSHINYFECGLAEVDLDDLLN